MSSHALTFHSTTFDIIDRMGSPWLKAQQIAVALGYDDASAVNRIHARNSDEFTDKMTCLVKLTEQGQEREVRIFSMRGAHLLAMFAKTKISKAFRKWILDLIESDASERAAYTANPGDVLNAAQAEQLRLTLKASCDKLPKDKQGAFMIKAWSKLKSHFGVSYRKIPQSEFTEALSLVTRHAIEWELLNAPTVKDIDPRALMLSGGATPTVPVTQQVRDAMDRKAWEMAREAYELSREHLSRAVATRAEYGYPQRKLNEQAALKIIDEASLGVALAQKHYDELRRCMDMLKIVQSHAAKSMVALSLDIENGMTK